MAVHEVFVGLRLDAGPSVAVGRVRFAADGEAATFAYNPGYLAALGAGTAPALDPVKLPGLPGDQPLPSAEHPGVIGDSAPDHWGQLVLRRLLALPTDRSPTPVQRLLWSGEDRIGALVFRQRGFTPRPAAVATAAVLGRYAAFIRSLEEGAVPLEDAELRAAAVGGSSAGGARPKCTVRDDDGVYWLAKYPRSQDPASVPAIEHAAMRLAARLGLTMAETRLHPLAGGERAVLVRRFDRTAAGGRVHYVSMMSLLAARSMRDGSYPAMAGILRRISADPVADCRELYRRMVFNVVCGNTDDHLKNHGMVLTAEGWRLSPAFDVTPQLMPDAGQAIGVGIHGGVPDMADLLSLHGVFLLDAGAARAEIAALVAGTRNWTQEFARAGAAAADIAQLAAAGAFDRPGLT